MSDIPTIKVKRIGEHALPVPSRAHDDDAGLDLRYAGEKPMTLWPVRGGCAGLIAAWLPVGFAFAIPKGYEGQVRPRSGLAKNHSVTTFLPTGTIDPGFRGEVHVALVNHGEVPLTIEHGDRIAQLVIAPVSLASCEEGDLDETTRGAGGFGSTGVK